MSRSTDRRNRVIARIAPPPGWHVVPFFDSAFAPCRCVTHNLVGVSAVAVAWIARAGHYHLRCLACGCAWTRAITYRTGGDSRLDLDASHPDERELRRRTLIARRARLEQKTP